MQRKEVAQTGTRNKVKQREARFSTWRTCCFPVQLVQTYPFLGGPHDHDLQLVIAEEGGVGGEAQEWQMFYDNDSSDDPIPWWFNSVTGESTWDCPIAIGLATTPPKEQEQQRGPEQGEEKRLTEAALETFADGHNMGGGGGRAMVASSSLWARKWSEKYQVQ